MNNKLQYWIELNCVKLFYKKRHWGSMKEWIISMKDHENMWYVI